MNQNGFLKPKIETGFDLIQSVLVQLNFNMNIEYSSNMEVTKLQMLWYLAAN